MNLKSCFVLCLLSGITILFSPGCSKNDSVTQLPPINGANNKITGYSGKDFLTANSFNSLKIEIQYMQGFQPDAVSVNNITSFLSSLINKPGGISVTQQQIPSGGKASYSINDIAVVEQNNRSYFNSGSQLAVYVLNSRWKL